MKHLLKNNGYTAVIVALTMPVLIAILGICLDGGVLLYFDLKLSTAVKFAAISATSVNMQNGDDLEITADSSFVQRVLSKNLNESELADFSIDELAKNRCCVAATYEVQFVFIRIIGIDRKVLYESYTAERNI